MKYTKHDIVQVFSPKTGLYTKINRTIGRIMSHKKTKGPYKNIKVVEIPCNGPRLNNYKKCDEDQHQFMRQEAPSISFMDKI